MRRLTAHRVAAVQAELIDRPQVAIAALTAQLAQKAFHDNLRGYHRFDPVFDISATSSHGELCNAAEDMKASAAWERLGREQQAWQALLPEDPDAYFPWLLTQPPGTALRLLTYVVGITAKGICAAEPEQQCNVALAQALGLDMTKWWAVGADTYLNHVPKHRVVEVVARAASADAASLLAGLKKGDMVADAELALQGKGWLPDVLRVGASIREVAGAVVASPGGIATPD